MGGARLSSIEFVPKPMPISSNNWTKTTTSRSTSQAAPLARRVLGRQLSVDEHGPAPHQTLAASSVMAAMNRATAAAMKAHCRSGAPRRCPSTTTPTTMAASGSHDAIASATVGSSVSLAVK